MTDTSEKWPTADGLASPALYNTINRVTNVEIRVDNLDKIGDESRYPSTEYVNANFATKDHNHNSLYAAIDHVHPDGGTGGTVDLSSYQTITKMDVDPDVDTTPATAHYPSIAYVALNFASKNHTHDLSVYALKNDVYTQTQTDTLLNAKASSTHDHDAAYAPLTGSTTYITKSVNDLDNYYTKTAMNTSLDAKASSTHDHDTAYAPLTGSTTYITKSVNNLDNYYDKDTSDGKYATVGSSGITKTQADTYYEPKAPVDDPLIKESELFTKVTDIGDQAWQAKEDPVDPYVVTSDLTTLTTNWEENLDLQILKTQTGGTDANWYSGLQSDAKYAPLTGSTTYITKSVNDLDNYYDKTAMDTSLGTKASSTHNHSGVYQPAGSYLTDGSVYQTKDNMVVVGAETTYYSGAKVDALLSAIGSGSSSSTTMILTNPDPSVNNPDITGLLSAGGFHGMFSWAIQSNTTPLTALYKPNLSSWPLAGGDGTVTDVYTAFQNRTANTYRVKIWFDLGSTMVFNATGYGSTNDSRSWIQWMENVPNDSVINNKIANIVADGYGPSQTGNAQYSPGPVTYQQNRAAYGMQFTRHLGARHTGSATFKMGPNDLFLLKYFTHCNTTLTDKKLYNQPTSTLAFPSDTFWRIVSPNKVNVLYLECTQV
jgi:hypothetical protein